MIEFVPVAVRQWENRVPVADAGKLGQQVGQTLRDEMNDLALPLYAATHGIHVGRQDGLAVSSKTFCQTTRLAMPLSPDAARRRQFAR